jgi:hypothetical protein
VKVLKVEELKKGVTIGKFALKANEPVSLSVIQLPLTLSIEFNLFTKLAVEILAVYVLNEDVVTNEDVLIFNTDEVVANPKLVI